MGDEYRPTAQIKWFRVESNFTDGEKPLAQIPGYPDWGPEWYCLKQLWISNSQNKPDEWRDIEVIA